MSAIESVLVENRVFPPADNFVKAARVSGMAGYQTLCDAADKDFEGFWAAWPCAKPSLPCAKTSLATWPPT